MNYLNIINNDRILNNIKNICVQNNIDAYIVGGYVRDLILNIKSKDVDIVVLNYSEEKLMFNICEKLNIDKKHVHIFKRYGTVSLQYKDINIEIVKAKSKSKSYKKSKNDVLLIDDLKRRDFTINTLALDVKTGDVKDYFNAFNDINNKILKTPINANDTFIDDAIRLIRAIRLTVKYNLKIEKNTLNGIINNINLLSVVSNSRLINELNKIMLLDKPSIAIELMRKIGILDYLLPEVVKLNEVEEISEQKHKNNYYHSLQVLDQTREKTDDLVLLWTALLHDIGKYKTKSFDKQRGWTFHNHEKVGAYLLKHVTNRIKFGRQFTNNLRLIIKHHGRRKELVKEGVTDSAVRRLLVELGDSLEDLLLFASCDMTTKYKDKKDRMLKDLNKLYDHVQKVRKEDDLRNFKIELTGADIMNYYNLKPSKAVGDIKKIIYDKVINGELENKKEVLFEYMINDNEIKKLVN
jgi:tRNA nucleotidyltransferase (CCA-adding enzyme)